jgi:hypothetical protein
MNKIAVVITPNGDAAKVSEISLRSLQTAVGGWVQAVDLDDDLTIWVNEEGKIEGLPVNPIATRLWEKYIGAGTDIIVGTAVFTGGTDEDGETLGLADDKVAMLMASVERL